MLFERERHLGLLGVVMSFEHERFAFDPLDAPGHQNFTARANASAPRSGSRLDAALAASAPDVAFAG